MDTFWAAFGGGAAGSVFTLLGVLLLDYLGRRRNRPLLQVELEFGYLIPGVQGLPNEYPRILTVDPSNAPTAGVAVIVFKAFNPNHFPQEVTSYGLYVKTSGHPILHFNPDKWGDQPPKMLAQGDGFTQTAPIKSRYLEPGITWDDVTYLWFKTRSGHEFRAKIAKRERTRIAQFLEGQPCRTHQSLP
jgi:hypothetical protein